MSGSRRLSVLAGLAALLFIVAEVPARLAPGDPVSSLAHQLPLLGAAVLASAALAFAYARERGTAAREKILALTDPLTDLPNRRALMERLAFAIDRHEPFTLLYVNLDNFRRVNDLAGEAAGDDVLRRAAVLMRGVGRHIDFTARVGGDEFGMFLLGAEAPAARMVAERIAAALREVDLPLTVAGPLTASFGVESHEEGGGAATIVEHAEGAAARAKQEGGDRLAFAMQAIVVRLGPVPVVTPPEPKASTPPLQQRADAPLPEAGPRPPR